MSKYVASELKTMITVDVDIDAWPERVRNRFLHERTKEPDLTAEVHISRLFAWIVQRSVGMYFDTFVPPEFSGLFRLYTTVPIADDTNEDRPFVTPDNESLGIVGSEQLHAWFKEQYLKDTEREVDSDDVADLSSWFGGEDDAASSKPLGDEDVPPLP